MTIPCEFVSRNSWRGSPSINVGELRKSLKEIAVDRRFAAAAHSILAKIADMSDDATVQCVNPLDIN